MAVKPILRLGHPVLRQVAKPVKPEDLETVELQQLLEDLIDTMRAAHSTGLTAPQIGSSCRVYVAEADDSPRYPNLGPVPLSIWINPEMSVFPVSPTVTMYEGCLSVPGLRGAVTRPAHLRLRAVNEHGQVMEQEFQGSAASVVQHELDHLDGVLFVDRAHPQTLSFVEELEQFVPPEERLVIHEDAH